MTFVRISKSHPKLYACEYLILPLGGAGSNLLRLLQGIVLMSHIKFRSDTSMRSLKYGIYY